MVTAKMDCQATHCRLLESLALSSPLVYTEMLLTFFPWLINTSIWRRPSERDWHLVSGYQYQCIPMSWWFIIKSNSLVSQTASLPNVMLSCLLQNCNMCFNSWNTLHFYDVNFQYQLFYDCFHMYVVLFLLTIIVLDSLPAEFLLNCVSLGPLGN